MASRVSVIVPVSRNAEPWLDQALDSIAAQTYPEVESIVVSDHNGSGVSATRNRGLKLASGEYVAFCDADDYLEPDAIERLVGAIGESDIAVGGFRKFGNFEMVVNDRAGELTMSEVAAYAMENLRNPRGHQMLSGCWAKLFKREFIHGWTKFDETLTTAEDMAFVFEYLVRCNSAVFLPQVVYHNRKRDHSITSTFDAENVPGLFGFLGGLRRVGAFLRGFYTPQKVDEAIDNSRVYHSCLYFMRICAHTGKPMREAFMELYP